MMKPLMFALVLGACTEAAPCTEIGCSDSLVLVLQPTAGSFADGVYAVATELDGVTATCSFTIGGAAITADDCHVLAPTIGLPQIRINFATAAHLRYAVSIDGVERASAELVPLYAQVAPNGPECGPTCRQAELAIDL